MILLAKYQCNIAEIKNKKANDFDHLQTPWKVRLNSMHTVQAALGIGHPTAATFYKIKAGYLAKDYSSGLEQEDQWNTGARWIGSHQWAVKKQPAYKHMDASHIPKDCCHISMLAIWRLP